MTCFLIRKMSVLLSFYIFFRIYKCLPIYLIIKEIKSLIKGILLCFSFPNDDYDYIYIYVKINIYFLKSLLTVTGLSGRL